MTGFLLAVQFFSVIPINKELPMTKRHVTMMFSMLPFVGACMGAIMYGVYQLLMHYTNWSSLLIAFLVILTGLILTGGLHLDGFVDTSDAYFSYRDREKRHAILDDPRIGAFGAMSLVIFLAAKVLFFAQLVATDAISIYWFLFIPFLARLGMACYLVQTPTNKETGLGAFFKSHILMKPFIYTIFGSLLVVAILVGVFTQSWLIVAVFVLFVLGMSRLYRSWTIKHFGGSSGDLYGAFIEGMELMLWILLLLLH